MAEFARLQIIVGEDLDRVLKDFHKHVEAASTEFSRDLKEALGGHFHGLLSNQIEGLIERLVQRISLGTVTPLAQLDSACLSLETFLGQRLQELNSQRESKILVAELSRRLSEHKSRIWTLVQAPELSQGEVGSRVMVGLSASRSLAPDYYCGILEGIVGRLGLSAPGATDTPSVREGVQLRVLSALKDSILSTEGREVSLPQGQVVDLAAGLHLDYNREFKSRRVGEVASMFTSSLLPGLIESMDQLRVGESGIPMEFQRFDGGEELWTRLSAEAKSGRRGLIDQLLALARKGHTPALDKELGLSSESNPTPALNQRPKTGTGQPVPPTQKVGEPSLQTPSPPRLQGGGHQLKSAQIKTGPDPIVDNSLPLQDIKEEATDGVEVIEHDGGVSDTPFNQAISLAASLKGGAAPPVFTYPNPLASLQKAGLKCSSSSLGRADSAKRSKMFVDGVTIAHAGEPTVTTHLGVFTSPASTGTTPTISTGKAGGRPTQTLKGASRSEPAYTIAQWKARKGDTSGQMEEVSQGGEELPDGGEGDNEEEDIEAASANLPSTLDLEDLRAAQERIFAKDTHTVRLIRGCLLGLPDGAMPSRKDVDKDPHYRIRSAEKAKLEKSAPEPEVVAPYWMDYLEENGMLANCPPEEFTNENETEEFHPIYTPESLREHLPSALSAFGKEVPPSLIAVVPADVHPSGKNYMLFLFHEADTLRRVKLTGADGKTKKQVAFCPWCGTVNENADTAWNDTRRHLDLVYLCGGCKAKWFTSGQALGKHMHHDCNAVKAMRKKRHGRGK